VAKVSIPDAGSYTLQATGVSSGTAPQASFSWTPTSPAVGAIVQFGDTSTGNPTSWSWTFGDGGTSNLQNPTHPYNSAGIYGVTLTVSNSFGSSTSPAQHLVVSPSSGCTITCSAMVPAVAQPGRPVQFQSSVNASNCTGGTTYDWSFGDGTHSAAA